MVFKGDAYDFDQDGFYATVLDLYRRDIIKIDTTFGTKIILTSCTRTAISIATKEKSSISSELTPGKMLFLPRALRKK